MLLSSNSMGDTDMSVYFNSWDNNANVTIRDNKAGINTKASTSMHFSISKLVLSDASVLISTPKEKRIAFGKLIAAIRVKTTSESVSDS